MRSVCIIIGNDYDKLSFADVFAQVQIGCFYLIDDACPVRMQVGPDDNYGVLSFPLGDQLARVHHL